MNSAKSNLKIYKKKWKAKYSHIIYLSPDSCPLAGALAVTFCRGSTAFRVNLTWFESLLREGVHLKAVGQPCANPTESAFPREDVVVSQCEGDEVASRSHDRFPHALLLIGLGATGQAHRRVHRAVSVHGPVRVVRQKLRTEAPLGRLTQLETVRY